MKRWIILLLCMIALPLQAAWYKTTGSAAIVNNDEEYARQQAIQDAMRQAVLKASVMARSPEMIFRSGQTVKFGNISYWKKRSVMNVFSLNYARTLSPIAPVVLAAYMPKIFR